LLNMKRWAAWWPHNALRPPFLYKVAISDDPPGPHAHSIRLRVRANMFWYEWLWNTVQINLLGETLTKCKCMKRQDHSAAEKHGVANTKHTNLGAWFLEMCAQTAIKGNEKEHSVANTKRINLGAWILEMCAQTATKGNEREKKPTCCRKEPPQPPPFAACCHHIPSSTHCQWTVTPLRRWPSPQPPKLHTHLRNDTGIL
jgi:hypothetical protein